MQQCANHADARAARGSQSPVGSSLAGERWGQQQRVLRWAQLVLLRASLLTLRDGAAGAAQLPRGRWDSSASVYAALWGCAEPCCREL